MRHTISLAIALLVAPASLAQGRLVPKALSDIPTSIGATQSEQKFRGTKVDGNDLKRAVKRVTDELKWHKKLSAAQQDAKQSGKPILWLQLLGDLDGYT